MLVQVHRNMVSVVLGADEYQKVMLVLSWPYASPLSPLSKIIFICFSIHVFL